MSYGNDDFVPIVLGTNLNAYNMARSLHEAYGVRTLALGRFAVRETADSQIVGVRAYRDFQDPERIVATLLEIADELDRERPGRTLVLLPLIEFYTNVVLEHRAALEQRFTIPLVGQAAADRLMNKTDFYRTCAELGVPHPESVIVSPATPLDETFGTRLPFGFPVICKPSNTDTYPRVRFEGKQKVYLVPDAAALRELCARIFAAGYADDLVVQEYLAGDESVMRVANTYSDRNGQTVFQSLGQVVVTEYDPKMVGNNNAIVSIRDDELAASIRTFLDGVGYTGTANFDVMLDRRTGLSKLLEINLRPGATSYYTMAGGGNLARAVIDDVVYRRSQPLTVTSRERLWLNVPYPVVRWFAPEPLRPLLRSARRAGTVHTLKYGPDMSWRRRLDVARIDLRHVLDYVRYAKNRPR
ncbi:hypothetical protein [Luteimicrobium subarcticum]|uniref:D-aspartate ligase n=1 Tax=Luteimicrobium subarcticum TaxID=620910 RepID=A0A2M8W441_9MICO|nr:hypothetical protein [Luteimicrobium subarcticum]PJI85678.1 D-aspartate ligase [Luteimicrobium subarcticum]